MVCCMARWCRGGCPRRNRCQSSDGCCQKFEFGSPGNDSIFRRGCATILDTSRIYHTDGLILTSNSEPLPDKAGVRFKHQFKWKPSKDNTVDFLINYERNVDMPTLDKVTTTIQADNNSSVQYKTMRLYVGSAKGKTYDDPRATIPFQEPLSRETEASSYKPALFHPIEFPDTMANTCYILIQTDPETAEEYAMTEDTKEPIANRSIVEMRYDPPKNLAGAGFRLAFVMIKQSAFFVQLQRVVTLNTVV